MKELRCVSNNNWLTRYIDVSVHTSCPTYLAIATLFSAIIWSHYCNFGDIMLCHNLCSIGFEWCPQRNTFTAFCLYAQIFHSLPDADLLVLVCWNTSVYQILWCMFLITFKYINWCTKRDLLFAWYHVSRYWLKTKDNNHAVNNRTYLNEVLFYHSSYMFSQYWSLHHKTIEYIPVELLNSNHRQFVSPNNSFSERVVFIHLHHVFKLRCIGMAIYLVMYLYTECSRRYRCVYSSIS